MITIYSTAEGQVAYNNMVKSLSVVQIYLTHLSRNTVKHRYRHGGFFVSIASQPYFGRVEHEKTNQSTI